MKFTAFMEPKSSLPCSQEPATGPYPEPDESDPHPKPDFLKIHFKTIIHFHAVLPSGLFTSGFPTKTLCAFLTSHACYMPRPPHAPWFITTITQTMELLAMQFYVSSSHFITRRSRRTHKALQCYVYNQSLSLLNLDKLGKEYKLCTCKIVFWTLSIVYISIKSRLFYFICILYRHSGF
jgi:hypothetical protein